MNREEDAAAELRRVLEEDLPEEIAGMNEALDDGLVLPPFSAVCGKGETGSPPFLRMDVHDGEYTEKDRLIECERLTVVLEMVLPKPLCRYRCEARYRAAIRAAVRKNRKSAAWTDAAAVSWKEGTVTITIDM